MPKLLTDAQGEQHEAEGSCHSVRDVDPAAMAEYERTIRLRQAVLFKDVAGTPARDTI